MAGVSQVVDTKPVYCSQEGAELIEYDRHRFSGYNIHTGQKRPDLIERELVCPINTDYHIRWVPKTRADGSLYWFTIG